MCTYDSINDDPDEPNARGDAEARRRVRTMRKLIGAPMLLTKRAVDDKNPKDTNATTPA